jgi:hypothetical protein
MPVHATLADHSGTEQIVMPKEYLYPFKGFLMGTVVSVTRGFGIAVPLHFLF